MLSERRRVYGDESLGEERISDVEDGKQSEEVRGVWSRI